ncbi:MAG: MBL fold metallo-hydrolase, partial [Patescibacteria group bacterium]|nr:MBL fold metallo-hydrolase [Patescibacteria group bacterium]
EQKIILAGSGMSSGGRIFGHEKKYLPDPKSTVLIVGYQAAGTVGRQLIEGAASITVRGSGEKIPVRAHIETLYGYSAHSDGERLLEFANKAAAKGAREIFIVHGEPAATSFLAQRIRDYLGTRATTPEAGDEATIDF